MNPHQRITDQGVAGLPIADGRAELLEEIMQTNLVTQRSDHGWLVPLAAAAAVVAVVGGAWTLSNGEDPDTSPQGPGFGSEPTARATAPGTEPATATPTAQASNTCVVMYESPPTPATETPELDHCDEVILDEQRPGDVVQEERYQRPPRPVLLTADGWEVDGVYNIGLDWVGPGDAEVHLDWVQTDNPEPFAYDRYDRPGERIDILGLKGRLTGFAEQGKNYQVLFTSPVSDGGPGLLLETSSLGPAEFRTLVRSLEWVDLAEYDAVVKPAVG